MEIEMRFGCKIQGATRTRVIRVGPTKRTGRARSRIQLFGLLFAVLATVSPQVASANLSSHECGPGIGYYDQSGYCAAQFNQCVEAGQSCGSGGGGGYGGGVYGGGYQGQWFLRQSTSPAQREWTSTAYTPPSHYIGCNAGWVEGSWADYAALRLTGAIVRNLYFKKDCEREPEQDWCNSVFCYARKPYAWRVTDSRKYEIFLS